MSRGIHIYQANTNAADLPVLPFASCSTRSLVCLPHALTAILYLFVEQHEREADDEI